MSIGYIFDFKVKKAFVTWQCQNSCDLRNVVLLKTNLQQRIWFSTQWLHKKWANKQNWRILCAEKLFQTRKWPFEKVLFGGVCGTTASLDHISSRTMSLRTQSNAYQIWRIQLGNNNKMKHTYMKNNITAAKILKKLRQLWRYRVTRVQHSCRQHLYEVFLNTYTAGFHLLYKINISFTSEKILWFFLPLELKPKITRFVWIESSKFILFWKTKRAWMFLSIF